MPMQPKYWQPSPHGSGRYVDLTTDPISVQVKNWWIYTYTHMTLWLAEEQFYGYFYRNREAADE